MNLEQVEREIYETYQWFHREAPSVKPQEHGRLAQLWRYVDMSLTD